jgi:hypothetical protein
VLIVLALVVVVGGAGWLLLGRDSGGGSGTGAPPDDVARSFIEAARNQDCETMVGLVSRSSFAGGGADHATRVGACKRTQIVPYEFAVTDAKITRQNGDNAAVTLTADGLGGTETKVLNLVKESGAWKVDLGPMATTSGSPSAGG